MLKAPYISYINTAQAYLGYMKSNEIYIQYNHFDMFREIIYCLSKSPSKVIESYLIIKTTTILHPIFKLISK